MGNDDAGNPESWLKALKRIVSARCWQQNCFSSHWGRQQQQQQICLFCCSGPDAANALSSASTCVTNGGKGFCLRCSSLPYRKSYCFCLGYCCYY